MVKGKSKATGAKASAQEQEEIKSSGPVFVESDPERFSALEYLIVNAVFWLFCILNFYVAKWFMGEATGLYFFFGVMAVGFSASCVLSYLHDRFYEDDIPETESP